MHEFVLLEILAIGLSLALLCGFIATRLHLSPIVGYLLAGFLVGPHSPGFVADMKLAYELSEAGVILLMFGVGLHFDLKDLLAVKKVAIPGAIVQTSAATICGVLAAKVFHIPFAAGLILGLCLAVASTVVLMRMLETHKALDSVHGHVAVGWLVVEDVITVLLLVLLPSLAGMLSAGAPPDGTPSLVESMAHSLDIWAIPASPASATGNLVEIMQALGLALLRLAALWVLILPIGGRVIPWCIAQIARSRSNELFTLAVLVFAFAIAVGAAVFFDTSVALGAFLAGMVVGKTKSGHRAAADLLPLRDMFAVLFFLSVGMLFNPAFIWENPGLIATCTAIVLVVKPATAIFTVIGLGYSARTALTVGAGLAQIGEFSFILATQAQHYHLIDAAIYNVLVACALISITLNPLLFDMLPGIEQRLRRHERLWNFLHRRARKSSPVSAGHKTAVPDKTTVDAIVVGYGPTGKEIIQALAARHISSVVIDLNMDTVNELSKEGIQAVYGDASQRSILQVAGVETARYLLLTLPELSDVSAITTMAHTMNPDLKIISRTRFLHDRAFLHTIGVHAVAVEEQQVARAMAELVAQELQTAPETSKKS